MFSKQLMLVLVWLAMFASIRLLPPGILRWSAAVGLLLIGLSAVIAVFGPVVSRRLLPEVSSPARLAIVSGWIVLIARGHNRPGVLMLWLGLIGFYGAIAAVIIWRRTRFPWLSASFSSMTLACATVIGLWLEGYRFENAPLVGIFAAILLFVAGGLGLSADAANQERELLKRTANPSETFMDRLLFRYVPHLRRIDFQ